MSGRTRIALAAAVAALSLAVVAAPASATTETFLYTGAAQSWEVPAGVTSATFDVQGAQGGSTAGFLRDGCDRPSQGGLGGQARATLPVTAGAVLQVNVGGQGSGCDDFLSGVGGGGFNGGGDSPPQGQGGGGASDVRTGVYGLDARLIVGGGGGGGHPDPENEPAPSGGAGGGAAGGNGATLIGFEVGQPGLGGGSAAGGVHGTNGPTTCSAGFTVATDGTLGIGGTGATLDCLQSSGGGGGGGYYGGGGGGGGGTYGGGRRWRRQRLHRSGRDQRLDGFRRARRRRPGHDHLHRGGHLRLQRLLLARWTTRTR